MMCPGRRLGRLRGGLAVALGYARQAHVPVAARLGIAVRACVSHGAAEVAHNALARELPELASAGNTAIADTKLPGTRKSPLPCRRPMCVCARVCV